MDKTHVYEKGEGHPMEPPDTTSGGLADHELPSPLKIDSDQIPGEATLVCAAGFEDRALATLQLLHDSSRRLARVFIIRYEPPSGPNREEELRSLAKSVSGDDPEEFAFVRFSSA